MDNRYCVLYSSGLNCRLTIVGIAWMWMAMKWTSTPIYVMKFDMQVLSVHVLQLIHIFFQRLVMRT